LQTHRRRLTGIAPGAPRSGGRLLERSCEAVSGSGFVSTGHGSGRLSVFRPHHEALRHTGGVDAFTRGRLKEDASFRIWRTILRKQVLQRFNPRISNERAFAMDALPHYAADNSGHSTAANVAVPLHYPKLGMKFRQTGDVCGRSVYHAETESAFDFFQAARGHYACVFYKSFIWLEVAKPVLQRALEDPTDCVWKRSFWISTSP